MEFTSDTLNVGAVSMDTGLSRPSPPVPAIVVTSSPLDLHSDDDDEITDSSPPTPRYNGDERHHDIDNCVTQREVFKTDERPILIDEENLSNIKSSKIDHSPWMDDQTVRTSESECQTQSDEIPNPSYAMPLEDDYMSLPRRSNGHHPPQTNDPHIAAILRDAETPQASLRSPLRSSSPTRPKLTHYSSADEILQRFSEKWKKYQEMTGDSGDPERSKDPPNSHEDEMPGRRRTPISSQSTKQLKRPSELEVLRQENSRLKKQLDDNEGFYNEKIMSLTSALEEGKKMWDKTSKENVELRSHADVDSLKMQRMEERIRMLENAMRQPSSGSFDDPNNPASWNDNSLRRVVDMQEQELHVLRKEIEVFQNRQKTPHYSSVVEQDAWRSNVQIPHQEEPHPATTGAYNRPPMYTTGGMINEDRLPKQYRSTGDLRGANIVPSAYGSLPRPSNLGRESPNIGSHSNTLPRSSSVGRDRSNDDSSAYRHDPMSSVNAQNKIYWIDDPPLEEPPRRSPSHPEPTFEPPKVHPMIVKMATKRKRQERSKTIGLGELQRPRSSDRASRDFRQQNDDRSKPWIQRVLNKRQSPVTDDPRTTVNSKPPSGNERPPSRQSDQRRVDVYCLGRRVRQNSGSDGGVEAAVVRRTPEPEMRHQVPDADRDEGRPPTSVLIESIRQRVKNFNMATEVPNRDHGPPDGRRSADIDRRRDESPQRVTRPASSMELGHHGRMRDYQNLTIEDMRVENDENEEDIALKHRVHSILDRRTMTTPTEQQPLRPPAHGPVRALHSWEHNTEGSEERWPEDKPQVPPLDLSKLKPEKIAQGTGLPTDMRNYADELIKKYMSSLAAANGE